MLCENCGKNEATGLYEDGAKGSLRPLCTACLLGKHKELFGGLDMFASSAPVKKSRCPKCGTDVATAIKTLFLGCPDCYKAFDQYLPPIIKNIQNAVTHVGAAPVTVADGGGYEIKTEIDALNAQLKAAVKEERYEDAAAISRRIKALSGGGV